jgi:hypothetical protein
MTETKVKPDELNLIELAQEYADEDKAFDPIRNRVLIETQPEHLLAVLRAGTVSTNAFLRKIHNFAVDLNWLHTASFSAVSLCFSMIDASAL